MVQMTLCKRCKGNIVNFREVDGTTLRCMLCGRTQLTKFADKRAKRHIA